MLGEHWKSLVLFNAIFVIVTAVGVLWNVVGEMKNNQSKCQQQVAFNLESYVCVWV